MVLLHTPGNLAGNRATHLLEVHVLHAQHHELPHVSLNRDVAVLREIAEHAEGRLPHRVVVVFHAACDHRDEIRLLDERESRVLERANDGANDVQRRREEHLVGERLRLGESVTTPPTIDDCEMYATFTASMMRMHRSKTAAAIGAKLEPIAFVSPTLRTYSDQVVETLQNGKEALVEVAEHVPLGDDGRQQQIRILVDVDSGRVHERRADIADAAEQYALVALLR